MLLELVDEGVLTFFLLFPLRFPIFVISAEQLKELGPVFEDDVSHSLERTISWRLRQTGSFRLIERDTPRRGF